MTVNELAKTLLKCENQQAKVMIDYLSDGFDGYMEEEVVGIDGISGKTVVYLEY
jgi:hypothetical protein